MRWAAILGALALLCLFAGGWQIRGMQADDARRDAAARAATAMPDALPDAPEAVRDLFRAVRIAGTLTGDPVLVPVTHPQMGAGVRVVQGIEVEGRRILIDRGFLYDAWKDTPLTATTIEANGNLAFPEGLADWAAQAGAAPVLVVAATPTGDGVIPMPVEVSDLAGGHGRAAAAWFALAGVLAGMTVAVQWRIKRRGEGHVTQ